MANTKEEYPVHKCVFEDDISTLLTLMRTHDCATKDKQGTLQFKKKKIFTFFNCTHFNFLLFRKYTLTSCCYAG